MKRRHIANIAKEDGSASPFQLEHIAIVALAFETLLGEGRGDVQCRAGLLGRRVASSPVTAPVGAIRCVSSEHDCGVLRNESTAPVPGSVLVWKATLLSGAHREVRAVAPGW